MIEDLRARAMNSVFAMSSFSTSWRTWRPAIAELTDNLTDAGKVYELGDHLSDVFKMTGGAGRDQGSLSGGGAAWEGLVCWYLNLVMTGSRAVVVKQSKSLIPKTLSDAMTVTYKNVPTNTESDLSGIIFPQKIRDISDVYDTSILNSFIENNISDISLHNIQCKTNWNDNAQIPMLWDMIYQFRGVKKHSVRIGVSGVDLDDLADFTYSFVTVPTQSKPIKPNSMAVRRVESLSGGNYWGRSSQAGVAESLSEIFKRVFKSAFDGGIRGHIDNQIKNGSISISVP
ncbi:hypothetical protein [Sphingopyxis sp. H115]|uniref:hypothetical protein n=1 Tax=Sphingopyxis sp. H115 TaxID=1759073 RepID=UPI000ADEFC56|nr:hypothetical protein [Sphingopyxis sp. H115]